MNDALSRIFTDNIQVKKDDNVLVLCDTIKETEVLSREERERRTELIEIARQTWQTGLAFCRAHITEYPSTSGHGKEPPVEVWHKAFGELAVNALESNGLLNKILDKTAKQDDIKRAEIIIRKSAISPAAIIALSNFSTSHTRFRDFLTRCMDVRYASMPLFDRAMLDGAMTADWGKVAERTGKLVSMFEGRDMVYVTSHNGTNISFSIKGRPVMTDTGVISEPGTFSNLPAGEAFMAPVEGTSNGMLILDYAPTRRLRHPVELKVSDGFVTDVLGADPFAEDLKRLIGANSLIGNIAELGIGTNDKATRPDNILETEKILGTVHIAIGDNSSFGGRTSVPFHEDFIFFRPTLEAINSSAEDDRIDIIKNGTPLF